MSYYVDEIEQWSPSGLRVCTQVGNARAVFTRAGFAVFHGKSRECKAWIDKTEKLIREKYEIFLKLPPTEPPDELNEP